MLCVAFVKNPYRWFILSKPVIFYFFNLFVHFQLCCLLTAARGLSPRGGVRGLLSCGAQALHCGGFSCLRARALGLMGSVVATARLQSTGWVVTACGLVAPLHVGSSRIRA